jgi:hypothetical protein
MMLPPGLVIVKMAHTLEGLGPDSNVGQGQKFVIFGQRV